MKRKETKERGRESKKEDHELRDKGMKIRDRQRYKSEKRLIASLAAVLFVLIACSEERRNTKTCERTVIAIALDSRNRFSALVSENASAKTARTNKLDEMLL